MRMRKDIDLILKEIIKITALEGLGTEIDIEDINDDIDLIDDLGFHSIVMIRFVVAIEEVLGVEIDEDDLYNGFLTKYSRLKDYLKKNVNN
jgi:acyl carrier protein